MRSVLRFGLKLRSTMESEDMDEIIGEPVWNVEDRDRGMIDLKVNKLR